LITRSPLTNWYYSLVAPWFLNSIELRLQKNDRIGPKVCKLYVTFMGMRGKLFSSCHLYFTKRNGRGEMSSPYKSEFTRWSTVIKFCHSKLESEAHPSSVQKSGSNFLMFFLNCFLLNFSILYLLTWASRICQKELMPPFP